MIMNRAFVAFLLLFFLCACAPAPSLQPITITTAPIFIPSPTFTSFPPTLTPSSSPLTPALTPTSIPCDPSTVDFCITDGHFLLQRPIHLPDNTSVDPSYRYASTENGKRDPHTGVEFVNKFGTLVYAAGEGTVIFAGPDSKPVYMPWPNYYGNLIVIAHTNGLYTLYAHLSKITVEQGQTVAAGEQIGEVGQSGVAIGPHLHFEVRRGDVEDKSSTENPELWLIPNQNQDGTLLGTLQLSAVNPEGQLVERAKFTLEHHPERDQPADLVYYVDTYAKQMLKGEENVGIGDLPAGFYRIVLLYNGNRYERWVEVKSGKLTQAVITVK
jgi:murein DD-endopeptidase MepM/ murein hydrolase activator NlpD